MTRNKNFSFTILFLWAITTLLPTITASKVALRDPCNPITATIVIEIVYTSSGVSSLPTATVTQTFTSTSGVPYSTPPGSGSGSNNGGGSPADPCATTTQYSIAIVTVGPQDTQTVTQSVTVTVPPTSSSTSSSTFPGSTSSTVTTSALASSTVPSSALTTSAVASQITTSSAMTSSVITSSAIPSSTMTNSATTSASMISSALTSPTPTSSAAVSSVASRSQSSTTSPSTSPSTTPVSRPTFWLRASNVSSISGSNTNAALARSNDQYARLFAASPADAQGSQNLDFALASSSSANVFTLDSQNRLVDINLGLIATSKNGTTQKVYFDPANSFLGNYTALVCAVQAASGAAAYSTLQCIGPGSSTGNQTLSAVCYSSASSDSSVGGANGKFFMSSSIPDLIGDEVRQEKLKRASGSYWVAVGVAEYGVLVDPVGAAVEAECCCAVDAIIGVGTPL
ncbi:hypothetical protein VM1G_09092 [Cytospora mali]|uniref:Uncharacterized protein n=1 Tax=Cytospora mali TaxID=578113 RepID=A0A194WAI8_CYTMA|nr:hypothetical protein VM1G_09092 [Valsa mali]